MGSTVHTRPLATCECPQLQAPSHLKTAGRMLWLLSEKLRAQVWCQMDFGFEAWLCHLCPHHMLSGNFYLSSPDLSLLICKIEIITVAPTGWGRNEIGGRKQTPYITEKKKVPGWWEGIAWGNSWTSDLQTTNLDGSRSESSGRTFKRPSVG